MMIIIKINRHHNNNDDNDNNNNAPACTRVIKCLLLYYDESWQTLQMHSTMVETKNIKTNQQDTREEAVSAK